MAYAVEYSVERLGTRLARLREAMGLTQHDLCDRTGLRQTTISSIETGATKRPHETTIRLIAAGMRIEYEDLQGYLSGKKSIDVRKVVGSASEDQPGAWVARNPKLLARAVEALILAGEGLAKDVADSLPAYGRPSGGSAGTPADGPSSAGRRSRRGGAA